MKNRNDLIADCSNFIESGSEGGAFVFIGVDRLRSINARLGYEYGNMVLKTLEASMLEIADPDSIYKMNSGDTYIIFIKDKVSSEEAKQVYYALREKIEEKCRQQNFASIFTISGGVTSFSEVEGTASDMFTYVEYALLKAKANGRNCIVKYDPQSYTESLQRSWLSHQLQTAVGNNFSGFEVYYQPIVDMDSMKTVGAEALLRFKCDGKMISPSEFIPVLEDDGLIVPVGLFVIRQAMLETVRLRKIYPKITIHINLSYVQFKRSYLYRDVMELLEETGALPENIVFEITESGFLMDDEKIHETLNGFRSKGIRIALDDFGTGYSNLVYLKDASLDIVKLDKMFVSGALENKTEHGLLKRIIDIVHDLGLTICLEGIESMSELASFRNDAPDMIQGYVFGRPAPADLFRKELEKLVTIFHGEENPEIQNLKNRYEAERQRQENKENNFAKRISNRIKHFVSKRHGYRFMTTVLPVMLCIIIVLTTLVGTFSYSLVIRYTDRYIEMCLKNSEDYLNTFLDGARSLAKEIAGTVSLDYQNGTVTDYSNLLMSSAMANTSIKGCGIWMEPYVLDPSQKYMGPYAIKQRDSVYITDVYSNSDYDYFNQTYYTKVKSFGVIYITLPYYDPDMDCTISTVAAPIWDAKGNFIGCSTVDVTVDNLQTLVNLKNADADGEFMLLAHYGRFIVGSVDQDEYYNGYKNSSNKAKKDALNSVMENEGTAVYKENGCTYKLYCKKLMNLDWKLVMAVNLTEKQHNVSTVITASVIMAVLTIAASIFILIKLGRKIESNARRERRQRRVYDETQLKAVQSAFEMIANVDIQTDSMLLVYKKNNTRYRDINENNYTLHRRDLSWVIHHEDRNLYLKFTDPDNLRKELSGKNYISCEFRLQDGEKYFWNELIISKMGRASDSAAPSRFVYMMRNVQDRKLNEEVTEMERQMLITQLRQANEVLFKHGISDSLTDVYNREGLEHYAPELLKTADMEGNMLLFVLADVNRLKLINDTFGHLSGDKAIKMVSRVLTCLEGGSQICARIGGDEFVYMAACRDEDEMPDVIKSMFNEELKKENAQSDLEFEVTFSYGYYWGRPLEGYQLDDYIRIADKRMYNMKNNTRA